MPLFFTPILGGCAGPEPGGRDDGERQAAKAPAALDSELARIRREYNTVRLHASIGYVTPDDEHSGRGPAIRRARITGLKQAHAERVKQNRANKR